MSFAGDLWLLFCDSVDYIWLLIFEIQGKPFTLYRMLLYLQMVQHVVESKQMSISALMAIV